MIKRKQIWVTECECEKCGYLWETSKDALPVVCAKCKNFRWNNEGARLEKEKRNDTESNQKYVPETSIFSEKENNKPIVEELKYILGEE